MSIISIILPAGYEDAEAFAKDCGVELWSSNNLSHLKNLTSQLRTFLIDNKPVQAFISLQMLEQEIMRICHITERKGGES